VFTGHGQNDAGGHFHHETNERYLLQKLRLFRVAAFFIADVGNGLILSCSSEFESSVCSQPVLSPGIYFPVGENRRHFRGLADAPDTIRGRDGFTRDFGCGRYENLSGAISWLTFFAGGAADVRRSRSDWRRELAESTICSQRKPRSFRCSAQPAGSRGVRRTNVWAVSCGGFRPLMIAVVMSGASQGRRRRE
jgi:hypothetical protein